MCTVRHRNEEKDYFSLDVLNYLTNKTTLTFFNENYPKKLRYQIFCFIMLVPNCPGAKLSVLTMLVPNCPFSFLDAKLSVCLLGAKLSVFTILVQNCQGAKLSDAKLSGANLSGAKLSYHRIHAVPHGEDRIRHFRRCVVFSSYLGFWSPAAHHENLTEKKATIKFAILLSKNRK